MSGPAEHIHEIWASTFDTPRTAAGLTIWHGPADIPPGHATPHFDGDGDCQCFCPACAKVTSRAHGVEESDCICPDCTCKKAEATA